MEIVFIGAGNVATHLALGLYHKAFNIVQVYSRTLESAEILSEKVGAAAVNDISKVFKDADLYVFSVKDSVLEDVISSMPKTKGIWMHTAGSISIDIFNGYTSTYGVFYPFQTFSKGRTMDWSNIPLFIEASDLKSLDFLQEVAMKLTPKIAVLSSDDRKYLHLTGVFACNFTNHMYALSEQFLNNINLPFDVVLPLIDETASKVHELPPVEAQTGPAVRFDQNVMNKHLELISDEKTKEIYKLLSENIYKINNTR